MSQCRGITQKNTRCKRSGRTDGYCHQHQPTPVVPQVVVPQEDSIDWVRALEHGHLSQILTGMKTHDINQPIQQKIGEKSYLTYPLILLHKKFRYKTLLHLLGLPSINPNICEDRGDYLLQLVVGISPFVMGDFHEDNLLIIKRILDRDDFDPSRDKYTGLFSYLPYNYDKPHAYEVTRILVTHPKIDINRDYKFYHKSSSHGSIIQLISFVLYNAKDHTRWLDIVRQFFSRKDLRKNIVDDNLHPLMLPYLKFHNLRQSMIQNRARRASSLPRPEWWTHWQKIAHQLQTPPPSLKDGELSQLRGYAQLIGISDPLYSPIRLCVALANHYEEYRKTLTYGHHLQLQNETDLLGNSFNEMPSEYIIADDDAYGFSISEISQLLKLKRHPYTGKGWDKVMVKGTPVTEYLNRQPINPVHLLHQMHPVTDEPIVSSDEQQIHLLMTHFSYITIPICQVYVENQRCREQLLAMIGVTFTGHPSFAEFVEKVIEHLDTFPSELRNMARQPVYRAFEMCQIYI